jgi:phosphoribosylanthranilate isomerase
MTWVKICGVTTERDLAEVARLGADAAGLVLAPSRRRLAPERARELAAAAPPGLELVAVVTELTAELVDTLREAGIGTVQWHARGDPEPDELALLAGFRVLRAVAVGAAADLERPEPDWLWAWVLDSPPREYAGGSGQSFDWSLAHRAAGAWRRPVILAGGLHPGNVEQALAQVRPWGVDVSTGVESEPGRKDPAQVAAFIQAVRRAERQEKGYEHES